MNNENDPKNLLILYNPIREKKIQIEESQADSDFLKRVPLLLDQEVKNYTARLKAEFFDKYDFDRKNPLFSVAAMIGVIMYLNAYDSDPTKPPLTINHVIDKDLYKSISIVMFGKLYKLLINKKQTKNLNPLVLGGVYLRYFIYMLRFVLKERLAPKRKTEGLSVLSELAKQALKAEKEKKKKEKGEEDEEEEDEEEQQAVEEDEELEDISKRIITVEDDFYSYQGFGGYGDDDD